MNLKLLLLSCVGLSLVEASSLAAAVTVTASENNFIRDGSSGPSIYHSTPQTGPSTGLTVAARQGLTGGDRKIYLRFDLASLAIESGSIASAVLDLTLKDSPLVGAANGNVTLNLYGITGNGGSFDQTTLTWDNAPQNDTSSSNSFTGIGSTVLLLGSVTIDSTSDSLSGSTISWTGSDLTTFLNNSVAGSVTLMISSDSHGPNTYPGFTFLSKELGSETTAPNLDLTIAAIPEPSVSALMAAASCGLFTFVSVLRWRRRKGLPVL